MASLPTKSTEQAQRLDRHSTRTNTTAVGDFAAISKLPKARE